MTSKIALPKVPLDEKDISILLCLMSDPRASIADIAREVGVQRDTVSYRIERFEKRNLINKYHVVLEPQALGFSVFMMVLIKLNPAPSSADDSFFHSLNSHPNVTHLTKLVGKYDYHLEVAARDIVAFDGVMDEIKAFSPGIIADIEIVSIVDNGKIDDFSGLVGKV